MATLSNEQLLVKLRKKVPVGSIGSYNSTRRYDQPDIVDEIDKLNSTPSKAPNKLLKLLWDLEYDCIINNIKNTATNYEEEKSMLLVMLAELRKNVALDDVNALGSLFHEDDDIQTKLTEYNNAKVPATKTNRKQSIQALAASRLNVQAKSAFPGTSDKELQLKSIFDSNDKSFAGRTVHGKRKASNDAANEAKQRRKTAEDELAAAKKKGDADLILAASLALSDAQEKATTAVAKSYNDKQAARRKASNDAANEAKQRVITAEDELAAAKKKGDVDLITAASLALSDAQEKATTAVAKSYNDKQAARRNVKKVGDFSFDRRTIFTGLGEAIAKQQEYSYANTTKSGYEVARILRDGVKTCESSQAILAKIKDCLGNSSKE